jgi:diaminohydroxyphosphoribosylaminopyrimidine deaminase/5-amino-6-(5-phosphoribosylamino)uracil reductase
MSPEQAMARAVDLSRMGFPAPNPHVGCVIVRDGCIVGEGFHEFAGGPHAEKVALLQAGSAAKGSTAFVTLEPCNHHGRTPPCSEALIEAGIARVVYAVGDPNPKASGGAQRLREAGIAVESGLLASEAREANLRWLVAVDRGRPWVTVKAAITLDGCVAAVDGTSKWITGDAARQVGHSLRAEHAGILVGSQTVIDDDPQLTARVDGVRNQPIRIVLDGSARLAGSEPVFRGEPGEWLWYCASPTGERQTAMPENLALFLADLWRRGINSVLIEGGPHTASRFIEEGLVDEIQLFVAPKILGEGKRWVEHLGIGSLGDALRFDTVQVGPVGEDIRIILRPTAL